MKKIVTMQDISCVGKCSLTVALPVLSSMGIETAVLPTAVLSTHTMFSGFTFRDLTEDLLHIMDHWKQERFHFDALYTGYLGSIAQIDIAKRLFSEFDGLRLVDPCMADNGKLYAGFTEDFVKEMRTLCASADIIVPNLTEASLLLDLPYQESYTEPELRHLLKSLCDLGTKTAILTGVSLSEDKLGAAAYEASSDTFSIYETIREPESFHGTGDLWASAYLGLLLNGKSQEDALEIACEFIRNAIHLTLTEENHNTYGVNFEEALPGLMIASRR
ncbi:MAG: pyridoxamine kinase [Solobacterium sp.]|nr:pyridoxamine kinase [Solobacterium sp.]